MNLIHKRRLCYVGLFVLGLSLASSLVLYSLKQNINVFFTPEELQQLHHIPNYRLRLGGMVKPHSLRHDQHGVQVSFVVTDFKKEVLVRYSGVLPDLFREGKGVIASGELDPQGIFIASEVLAKHDETYRPRAVMQKALSSPNTQRLS